MNFVGRAEIIESIQSRIATVSYTHLLNVSKLFIPLNYDII